MQATEEFSFKESLERLLVANEKRDWDPDKEGNYYPSLIGFCDRALYYSRTNAERVGTVAMWPSDIMITRIGSGTHDQIQALMAADGVEMETRLKDPVLHISGRADVIFRNAGVVGEIKTIGDASFKKLVKPKPEHVIQAHCYMHILGFKTTQFLYVNRNDGHMRQFTIQFDDNTWAGIEEILAGIERQLKAGEIPAQESNKWKCTRCSYYGTCRPEGI